MQYIFLLVPYATVLTTSITCLLLLFTALASVTTYPVLTLYLLRGRGYLENVQKSYLNIFLYGWFEYCVLWFAYLQP